MSKTDSERLQTLIDDLERSIASFDERCPTSPTEETAATTTPGLPTAPLPAARAAEHVRGEALRRKLAAARIGRALRQLSDHFEPLMQQLNLLQPAFALDYACGRQRCLDGLRWHEGTTRIASDNGSERALPVSFTMSIRLAAAPASMPVGDSALRRVEHTQPPADPARHDIAAQGLGRRIEVADTLPIQLVFSSDLDQSRIMLHGHNLLRLGRTVYAADPAAIDAATMELLGDCLLGRSKRLPNAFTPIALTATESAT